jgi:phage terminase small subunit
MATRVVAAKTMQVGKKGGGKHWTTKEKEARDAASKDFERNDDAKIKPPIWLRKDALQLWNKKIAEISGLAGGKELLDALDSEILALFCDAVILYKRVSQKKRMSIDDHKLSQTYMLRILGYSERLGFTPGARARLVKKRAEGKDKDEFGEMFD